MTLRDGIGDGDDATDDHLPAGVRMTIHERICSIRYKMLHARIGRLEAIVICSTGALMIGMASIIAAIVLKKL